MKPLSYRPLNPELVAALEQYQSDNFLPSFNAAINHALSMFLLKGGTFEPSQVVKGSTSEPETSVNTVESEQPIVALDWD